MIRFAANDVTQPCLDPHKVRGELSIRRLVLAGRMVLKNDLEVLSLDNSSGLV
jgi:hypothetical protein